MKVFKFGGASVKDADGVRNLAKILKEYHDEKIVVIVSAMGKTTNSLEHLVHQFFEKDKNVSQALEIIKKFHFSIIEDLFLDKSHPIFQEIHNSFIEIEWQLEDDPIGTFDFEYDQMVSVGEMLSTKIISAYLKQQEIVNSWMDARDLIRTDNSYRKANVDWEVTEKLIQRRVFAEKKNVIVSQGFVGGTSENFTTTLGREGSDFSAAIFAKCLKAEEVIIWKDVDGMLNADPKYFSNTIKLNNISYREAVELAYYGASVIHPKTIKPLQNGKIPLNIKSFINPHNKGTLIDGNATSDSLIPSFIKKKNQVLVSISSKKFDFVAENSLSEIYRQFDELAISINCMQNSAISFSVCIDHDERKFDKLIDFLKKDYQVFYNEGVELITIRHYKEEIVDQLLKNRKVLLEQKTRNTARFAVR